MAKRWAEPFARVFTAMQAKAMQRAYHGPWDDKDLPWALGRLDTELLELHEALENGTYEDVRDEVADCCNYLAIVLDLYRLRMVDQ
jgi:NTP pyrophosphatase (non-canonical NTP hydrolase)